MKKRHTFSTSEIFTENHGLFSKIVADSYNLTDWLCVDYPKYFYWFYERFLPGIFSGKRELISVYVDNCIAGTIFLKHDDNEQKICTLYVDKEFRGQGIATVLLKAGFKWLETTKPLISIAEYKVSMFKKIIETYDWELVQTLEAGCYNNCSRELVYNGKIK